jgi:hypothetical protein
VSSTSKRPSLVGVAALLALALAGGPGRTAPPAAPRFAEEKAEPLPAAPPASLPDTVGAWVRSPVSHSYDSIAIFDYMDGAAEIYVGYRFRRLDVHEYAAPGEEGILVELYWLESSDDAFGLLSLDWSGEAVDLRDESCADKTVASGDEPGAEGEDRDGYPAARALYDRGYLRIWSDDLFARMIAQRESPAARRAMLEIAHSLVAGRRDSEPPSLLQALPLVAASGARLRPDEVRFVRSHLVLNSIQYLADENVLNLGPATGCILGAYDVDRDATAGGACRLLVAEYPAAQAASAAREHLRRTTLTDAPLVLQPSPAEIPDTGLLEGAWAGCLQIGKRTALAFECPDRETAEVLVTSARL